MRTRITRIQRGGGARAIDDVARRILAGGGMRARQLFDAKHILWITFILHTLSLYCSICSARIVRFHANIEIFSLSTAEIILFLSPIDVDRADGRQSVARKLYPREGREIRVFEKRPQSNGIAKRDAGVSQDITSRFPFIRRLSRHSLFLSFFSAGAHLFAIVCCSRFCLICPSTRITRRSSSPRREVPLSRRSARILGDFAIQPRLPAYVRIRARGGPTVSPLAVPRKKRGNHFGILSGITKATREEGESTKRSE